MPPKQTNHFNGIESTVYEGNFNQGSSSSSAFVVYVPQLKKKDTILYCNEEAHSVLFRSFSGSGNGRIYFSYVASLCARWKELLDKRSDVFMETVKKGGNEADFLDLLKSERRVFGVTGVVLDTGYLRPAGPEQKVQYLFIMERVSRDSLNLSRIFRMWNLNNREKEIIRLLLDDRSNKEIAQIIGLSLNTVKGYMKLLTRKFGVTTRTGIVAALMTGRPKLLG
ncbi:MAG: response regulator transcription factor [Candidatus Loosdrechtia sp.]|uniref:LuxR C-terminal-related transcriptional regulator n=1 Tax=Candidatus Loosdrechtia sp. TaxID=3101272 RepID=UPI003A77AD22|nr:MAG: LuxR C-terminal-related transcriptional regulator [Candidatus Jettenia sp. AMX2]